MLVNILNILIVFYDGEYSEYFNCILYWGIILNILFIHYTVNVPLKLFYYILGARFKGEGE